MISINPRNRAREKGQLATFFFVTSPPYPLRAVVGSNSSLDAYCMTAVGRAGGVSRHGVDQQADCFPRLEANLKMNTIIGR